MSRQPRCTRACHAEVAEQLRANPGEWRRVSVHRVSYAADGAARRIRNADRITVYQPAGAFDAVIKPYGDDTAVYARYLGAAFEDALLRKPTTEINTQEGGA